MITITAVKNRSDGVENRNDWSSRETQFRRCTVRVLSQAIYMKTEVSIQNSEARIKILRYSGIRLSKPDTFSSFVVAAGHAY